LRVPKVENLVEQLVHQHEVVLDGFFIELAKVCLSQPHQSVEKLKHEGRIGIALRHRHQVYVFVLDMAERRRAEREDGRPDLCVGYYLDAEDVGEPWAAIIPEGAEYEVFALLVEYQDS